MYRFRKLPLDFDTAALCTALTHAHAHGTWLPHFVTSHYKASWSAIPLRSPQVELCIEDERVVMGVAEC